MSTQREYRTGERCMRSGYYLDVERCRLVRVLRGHRFPLAGRGRARFTFVDGKAREPRRTAK